MKIFKKLLLTTALLSTSNVVLADQKVEKNKLNIFNDKYLISNNYFDIGDSDTLKITVTGTRTERSVLDFPGSVQVYDFNELENSGSSNWRELFKNDPSLGSQDFMRSDYYRPYAKGDSGNINIRGLEGNRILTQIDGITIPRFSYGDSTFSVSRQNFIELSNLGKVEVLKGSSSSLYGSDALGGVVSLRSLNPEDILEKDKKEVFKITGSYNSANSSYKPNLKYAFRDGNLEGILSLTYESLKELERKTDKSYINPLEGKNNSYYGKFLNKINENNKISISIENLNKDTEITYSSGNRTATYSNRNNYTSSIDLNESKTTRSSLEYEYKSPTDKLVDRFKGNIYISSLGYENEWQTRGLVGQGGSITNENQLTTLDQDTIGTSLQFTNNISNKDSDQRITFGFEGSLFNGDRVAKESTATNNLVFGTPSIYRRNPESDVTKMGIFIQNEFSKGKFDVIGGVRYDQTNLDAHSSEEWYNSGSAFLANKSESVGEPHDIDESSFSPHLSVLYKINESTNLFGKYSRGFRVPSWEEVNSSHINIFPNSFSPTGYTAYSTLGNPNLKPETSDNFEIGFKSIKPKFDLSLSAFYQKFKDFLDQSALDGTTTLVTSPFVNGGSLPNTPVYRTKNVAKAKIYGIELDSIYYFDKKGDGFSFGNSLAFQVGDDETANEPLQTVNPLSLISNLKYIFPNKKFVINLSNSFTGVPRLNSDYKKGYPTSSTTYSNTYYQPKSYNVTDLKLAYKVNDGLSTSLGIYNIFDTTYYKWSDLRSNGVSGSDDKYYQRYAQPGTSIQASFSWRF